MARSPTLLAGLREPGPAGQPGPSSVASMVHAEQFVTPEIAAAWLASSKGNRPIRAQDVAELARLLVAAKREGRDDGLLSPDPVVFLTSGALFNAHHRLMAIVRAGVGSRMLVCRNYPDSAEMMSRVDLGRKRTIGDQAFFAGDDVAVMRRAGEILRALRTTCHLGTRIRYEHATRFLACGGEPLTWAVRLSRTRFPAFIAGAAFYAYPLNPAVVQSLFDESTRAAPSTDHAATLSGVVRDARKAAQGGGACGAFGAPFSRTLGVIRRALDGESCVIAQPWARGIEAFDARRKKLGLPSLAALVQLEEVS